MVASSLENMSVTALSTSGGNDLLMIYEVLEEKKSVLSFLVTPVLITFLDGK